MRLADACARHSRRLVYTGGCFDWGDHGEDVIDEGTPLTSSPMGVGHARMATELDARHERDGPDVVRLSPRVRLRAGRAVRVRVHRAGPARPAALHRGGHELVEL